MTAAGGEVGGRVGTGIPDVAGEGTAPVSLFVFLHPAVNRTAASRKSKRRYFIEPSFHLRGYIFFLHQRIAKRRHALNDGKCCPLVAVFGLIRVLRKQIHANDHPESPVLYRCLMCL
jgi:hypothetical protein